MIKLPIILFVLLVLFTATLPAQMIGHVDLAGDKPEDVFLRLIRDGDQKGVEFFLETFDLPLSLQEEKVYEYLSASLTFQGPEVQQILFDAVAKANDEVAANRFYASEQGKELVEASLYLGHHNAFTTFWEGGARLSEIPIDNILFDDNLPFLLEVKRLKLPLILKFDASLTIERAAFYGAENIVRWQLRNGADPDFQRKSGFSVLHSAVYGGSVGVVKALLEQGADVNVHFEGFSILASAVHTGNPELVDLVIQSGADRDFYPQQVGYLASCRGDPEILNKIEELGIRWDGMSIVPDPEDRKPLQVLNEDEVLGSPDIDFAEWQQSRRRAFPRTSDKSETPTVAFLYEGSSSSVGALVESELHSVKGVQLVERNQLNKILSERAINLSNLGSRDQMSRLALIPADHAVLLREHSTGSDPKGKQLSFLTCDLFTLQSGRNIGSWALPLEVHENAELLESFLKELKHTIAFDLEQKSKPLVSLNPINPNDTRRETMRWSNQFNELLRMRLASMGLDVVNPETLPRALLERGLGAQADTPSDQFWSLRGGIRSLDPDTYSIQVFLSSVGNDPTEYTVEGTDMVRLLQDLGVWIHSQTSTVPLDGLDSDVEAKALSRHSDWAIGMGFYKQGIRLADAAWTVSPSSALLWNRFYARATYLGHLRSLLEVERRRRGFRINKQFIKYGAFEDLDPLQWYDFGVSDEDLLSLLQETYALMDEAFRSSRKDEQVAWSFGRLNSSLDDLNTVFGWYLPWHMQNKWPMEFTQARNLAQQAHWQFLRALEEVDVELLFKRDQDRRIHPPIIPELIPQLGFFYSEDQLFSFCKILVNALNRCGLRHPTAFDDTFGRSTFSNHQKIPEPKGLLASRPRPVYPYSGWENVAKRLAESEQVDERMFGLFLTISFQPPHKVGHQVDKWLKDRIAVSTDKRSIKDLRRWLIFQERHYSKFSGGDAAIFLPELRQVMIHSDEAILWPRPYIDHRTPGYTAFFKDQAEKYLNSLKDPKFRYEKRNAEVARSLLLRLENLRKEKPKTEITATPTIKPRLIRGIDYFYSHAQDHSRKYTAWKISDSEDAVWYLFRKINPDQSLLYRLDRRAPILQRLQVPDPITQSFIQDITVSENDDYLLLNRSVNFHSHNKTDNNRIYLYRRQTDQWHVIEEWVGVREASSFALPNGEFIFLASPVSSAVEESENNAFNHTQIVRYNPETDTGSILADNLRTPAKYPFETSSNRITKVQLTNNGKNLRVWVNQKYVSAGEICLETGESPPPRSKQNKLTTEERDARREEKRSQTYSVWEDSICRYVDVQGEYKRIEVKIDTVELNRLIRSSDFNSETKEFLIKELLPGSHQKHLSVTDDYVIMDHGLAFVFFPRAQLDSLFDQLESNLK